MIAISFIGFLSHVDYSTGCNKVPKTHCSVSADQLTSVACEIPASTQMASFIVSFEMVNKTSAIVEKTTLSSIPAWTPPDRNIRQIYLADKLFSGSVGIIPDVINSPHGSITYLKTGKPCYASPHIDNKWIWQFSELYNC